MKTDKEILKTSKQASEIIEVCEKVSKKSLITHSGGYGSVRIGTAHIQLSEDEHRNVVDAIQYGDLYLHIGTDTKGFLYITNISFFDDYAHMGMRSGKYVKDDIISIKLFDDAYERIVNKIISLDKYYNDTQKTNKEQIALLQSI